MSREPTEGATTPGTSSRSARACYDWAEALTDTAHEVGRQVAVVALTRRRAPEPVVRARVASWIGID